MDPQPCLQEGTLVFISGIILREEKKNYTDSKNVLLELLTERKFTVKPTVQQEVNWRIYPISE